MATLTSQQLHPNQVSRMMRRLGLDPAGGIIPQLSLSYIAAFHRCEACPSIQACRDWLDSAPASAVLAPDFCPNGDIFLELQVAQPGAWIDKSAGIGARMPPRDAVL